MMIKKAIRLFSIITLITQSTFASELTKISVLTDQILLLEFDDGYVEYAEEGKWYGSDDQIFHEPLDRTLAEALASYSIGSTSDANYSTPLAPTVVGIKSKVGDASWKNNTAILNHWVYLELPFAMQEGATYSVDFSGLGLATSEARITYQNTENLSEAIHVNQIGFTPDATYKMAYVYQWLGTAGPLDLDSYASANFHLIDLATDLTAYSGTLTLRKDLETGDPDTNNFDDGPLFSGSDVFECDFSSFQTPGSYKVVVEGIGSSYPFIIDEDAYFEAYKTTTRGLYHHRSGPARELPYSSFPKGIDHMPGVDGFKVYYSDIKIEDVPKGQNKWFQELVNNKTDREMPEAWGAWFDAGDYDRQARHMIVSNLLLLNYIMAPEKYVDNELNIPESGNGIPDIIDEAKWGLDLFMRCKGPSGGIIGGVEANDHPHQTGSVLDGSTLDWYTYAESAYASYIYASAMVQLAAALEIYGDPAQSQTYFNEALAAYNWAERNQREEHYSKVQNERLRAAGWMYYYTGDTKYESHFIEDYDNASRDKDFGYFMGPIGYLLSDYDYTNATYYQKVKDYFMGEADALVAAAQQRASRIASFKLSDFTRVGIASTPYNTPLNVAYELTGKQEYLDYSRTTADYFLGGNAINSVYVTGLGDRPVSSVFNQDAFYDGVEEEIPGIVPYGFHTYGSWMDGAKTPNQPMFNYDHMYPDFKQWPSHEYYWYNRYTIVTNEYTIWQNIAPAATAYGYLVADKTTIDPSQFKRMIVSAPQDGQAFIKGADIELGAVAQIDGKTITKVKFYVNDQLVSETDSAPFTATYNASSTGSHEMYFEAYVNDALESTSETVSFEVLDELGILLDIQEGNDPIYELEDQLNFEISSPTASYLASARVYVNDEEILETFEIPFTFELPEWQTGTYKMYVRGYGQFNDEVVSDTLEFEVVDEILSTHPLTPESPISIYPNPVNQGIINLSVPTALSVYSAQIIDTVGHTVYYEENVKRSLQLTDLSPGLYVLLLQAANGINRFRIVIE